MAVSLGLRPFLETACTEEVAPADTFSLKNRGGSARPPACLFFAERPWPGPGASLEVKGPGSAESSPLRRFSQTPGTHSRRTYFREQAAGAPPRSPQWSSGARPGDTAARPGRDAHQAALTQLGLNGRYAHHHVRAPLLHSRRGPLPDPGYSAAT